MRNRAWWIVGVIGAVVIAAASPTVSEAAPDAPSQVPPAVAQLVQSEPSASRSGADAAVPADPADAAAGAGDAVPVEVDADLLAPGEPQTVGLDLSIADQAAAPAVVELAPEDGGAEGWDSWSGTVAGEPDSTVTVVRQDDVVAGIVTTTDGSYRIRPEGDGDHVLQRVRDTFPEGDDHRMVPATPPPGVDISTPVAGDPSAAAPDASVPPAGDVPTYPEMRVLVAYTPATLAQGFGGSTSNLNADIALSISTTNSAYSTSGIAGRVVLAGTTAISPNLQLDDPGLERITGKTDGYADEIHTKRNNAGADLVAVYVDDPSSCGLAWVMSSNNRTVESPYAFSLVHWDCAVGNYSFPHELGHNMGALHDRYVESNGYQFNYAYGYVNTTKRWRTIMAYNNQCSAMGFNCTRLGRFSNPDQTLDGVPLGRPISGSTPADNRRALNVTQPIVAKYRSLPAPFTTWSKFVSQQYKDFQLGTPSSSTLNNVANQLSNGAFAPDEYLLTLLNGSFGAAYAPVARLYFAYFLRTPDPGGLDYWVRRFQGGMRLQQISSSFAASSEFKNTYGTRTNRQFVDLVYENVLGRPGDAGGVNYWTGQLDQRKKNRGEVMIGFSESSEYKRVRAEEINVVLLYRAMLQRAATPTEFADQVARLEGGTTVNRLILEILDSSAYSGRVAK